MLPGVSFVPFCQFFQIPAAKLSSHFVSSLKSPRDSLSKTCIQIEASVLSSWAKLCSAWKAFKKRETMMITPVNKVMSKTLFAVPVGTSAAQARELMLEKRLRHLPVIDENADIVGMVSERDLQHLPLPKKISVDLIMTSPVFSVSAKSSLR
jgi:signal-transduction protein with cAMP-binding, CBS, and nucleotidyltransferase domain